jgi:hypothetical protein
MEAILMGLSGWLVLSCLAAALTCAVATKQKLPSEAWTARGTSVADDGRRTDESADVSRLRAV